MPFSTTIKLGDVLTFSQAAPHYPQQIEAGDFNGDGKIDFLINRTVGDGAVATTLRLMMGQGNGQWVDQTDVMFNGAVPTVNFAPRVAVADLNGDGRSDVYIPDYGNHAASGAGGYDQVWLSTPSGRLTATVSSTLGPRAHGVTTGDVDRDGDVDVIVNNIGGTLTTVASDLFLVNNGAGVFTDTQSLLPPGLRTGATGRLSHTWSLLADLTGDGAPDLVLGTWDAAASSSGRLGYSPPSQLLINDGRGSFAASTILQLGQSPISPEVVVDIDAVDLNGDGLNDLVLSVTRGGDGSTGSYYGTGYLQFLINRGGGTFTDETAARYSQQVANATGPWWKFVRVVDFNRDGSPDLLLSASGGGAYDANQAGKLLLNDGTGRFSQAFVLPTTGGIQPDSITWADVDSDGDADLVYLQWTSQTTMSLSAALNDYPYVPATGTAGADRLVGTAGPDTFAGLGGNDVIDGGAGTDTAGYAAARTAYTVTRTSTGLTVLDKTGAEGTDTLSNVERLVFIDQKLAFDVGVAQAAGQAELLLGAVLGRVALAQKPALLGAVIGLFDQGFTLLDLSGAVMRLPIWGLLANGGNASASNQQIASYLLTTVNGAAPDAVTLASATASINTGVQGDFLAQLAASAANQTQVGLVGLSQTGLAYTA
ncbi:MAG: VCBS repeat-containing protein [Burkholderiales bacterium]|nr:VCBS repeat-containing protein [Burkholderiales bacterium]